MSTDFEDRIARLNAKNGVVSAVSQSPAPKQTHIGRSDAAARASGPIGSIGKFILLGVLVLVIMPIGAAMATIYLAQTNDALADMSVSVEGSDARSD
jgi:hypothetical protein